MYGLGSEKVEADLQRHFPGARTLRWDWDTTRERDAHEVILAHFAAGRADVLIGTQMIAKGLDIPRVTLVGMVLADVGLNLPDPFAVERVFQTLTHAAGRAGRGEADGNVVLQTFLPEHYAIQAVAAHDVDGFYQQEAKQRRRLGYPPFSRLLRLEYRHPDAARAEQQAHHVARAIEALGAAKDLLDSRQANELRRAAPRETTLIGPAPCFYRKLNGQYRWQIVLRGPNPADRLPAQLADGWRIEVDPISLL
jgi:primosomal protein N' (replication factor Y)